MSQHSLVPMAPGRLLGLALAGLACILLLSPPIQAQGITPQEREQFKNIVWQRGPCTANVTNLGQVKVPAGCKFTGEQGTKTLLELFHNPATPRDLGLLCPEGLALDNNEWFITFEWDGIGFVKDDEKKDLNANALMESMRKGQEGDNNVRRQKGWPTLELEGWELPPFYDPQSNNLTWATRVKSGMFVTVNYNSRLLGRGGVMSVNLIISPPERLKAVLPQYQEIVGAYSYLPGQKYAEFRPGDKVATYGLTALVAGGAAGLAAKSGLLGKLGKFIVVIVVAVGGGIAALFKKIFGRGSEA